MTGGQSDNDLSMDTAELMDLNEVVKRVTLPGRFYGHCVTLLNTSHSIIVGGYFNSTQSLIINSDNFETTEGPLLAGKGRYYHGCAHISNNNGSTYVIATGGLIGNTTTRLNTAEILNADNISNGWTPGKYVLY